MEPPGSHLSGRIPDFEYVRKELLKNSVNKKLLWTEYLEEFDIATFLEENELIIIRADANEQIGVGHVMRCLTIAHAFTEKGQDVLFVTADQQGARLIRHAGFEVCCLDSNWRKMEDEGIQRVVNEYKPNLLLVDSYYVTEAYFNRLSGAVPVAYIDDLNTATWNVDYLINYNIFSDIFDYSKYKETNTELILCLKYVPLRPEFHGLPEKVIEKRVTDVFVSAGGADPEGITEVLIEEICPKLENVRFHFVVGTLNPRLDKIKGMADGHIFLHINEKHMAALMESCDIAVSAAGSTLYELCAVGIPTITYILADNQIAAAVQFEKQGMMLNAGDCRSREDFLGIIDFNIRKLDGNMKIRREMSHRMRTLIDGKGVDRLAAILLKDI